MPLKKGKKNLGRNIKELVKSGKPKNQALAIALAKIGLSKPNRKKKKSK